MMRTRVYLMSVKVVRKKITSKSRGLGLGAHYKHRARPANVCFTGHGLYRWSSLDYITRRGTQAPERRVRGAWLVLLVGMRVCMCVYCVGCMMYRVRSVRTYAFG